MANMFTAAHTQPSILELICTGRCHEVLASKHGELRSLEWLTTDDGTLTDRLNR